MEEMKRITKYSTDGSCITRAVISEPTKQSLCTGCKEDCVKCSFKKAVDKLAAYEDIGTPEQFQKLMDAQKNEPLTVEELRQMDGEPVYTVTGLHLPCPNDEWWAVSHIVPDSDMVHFHGAGRWRAVSFDEYGKTWLAYRRKPEGETE